jgi:PIN domain nuclease of toxin-antitoxin system
MMLADACALLAYFGAGDSGMSSLGLEAFAGEVAVSPITVWELTRKAAIGKLPPLPTDRGSFARHLAGLGFRDAPLLWADAEAANALPPHHRDPMDRMLIATALRLDLAIITNDAVFSTYGVRTVW